MELTHLERMTLIVLQTCAIVEDSEIPAVFNYISPHITTTTGAPPSSRALRGFAEDLAKECKLRYDLDLHILRRARADGGADFKQYLHGRIIPLLEDAVDNLGVDDHGEGDGMFCA